MITRVGPRAALGTSFGERRFLRKATSRRLLSMVLTGALTCFVALGASDAVAKKPRKHHGPSAPAGPSLAKLQALECAKFNCDANTTVTKLTVLTRGAVHRGSGRTARVGGDGIPTNTWVYPMVLSYDETVTTYSYTGGGYAPIQKVANTEVTHWREKDNVLREPSGAFVLRFVASSSTCEPSPNACTPSTGGGA
jgi:hypothetical protein